MLRVEEHTEQWRKKWLSGYAKSKLESLCELQGPGSVIGAVIMSYLQQDELGKWFLFLVSFCLPPGVRFESQHHTGTKLGREWDKNNPLWVGIDEQMNGPFPRV